MSTVAIIATLTLIGSMIGSIALNIFSNFLTNWLEDWQSKRSLINARKDIDKLKHDYDRIEKYHKDKPFFYLFLFQCVFYFLIGVTIQISLYGLTLFIWINPSAEKFLWIDYPNEWQNIIAHSLIYIDAITTYSIVFPFFTTCRIIRNVRFFDKYQSEIFARISKLESKLSADKQLQQK